MIRIIFYSSRDKKCKIEETIFPIEIHSKNKDLRENVTKYTKSEMKIYLSFINIIEKVSQFVHSFLRIPTEIIEMTLLISNMGEEVSLNVESSSKRKEFVYVFVCV